MADASPDVRALTCKVEWRDLVPMRFGDGCVECLHPLPWLLGSWWCAEQGLWPIAAACSFLFFLTALRLNHEAIHRNLGFGPRGHQWVIHGLSAVMLGSNTAIAFNHLRHHAHLGRAEDVEGKCGRMNFRQVLLYGPLFPLELCATAWRRGNARTRRRMAIDLALNAATVAAALAFGLQALQYHVLTMLLAQCLTAYFAVWITHRGCDGEELVARTQRSRLINFITYNMFFHLEHHLFPAVPVKRLGRLAERLDTAAPTLAARARRVL
ncbi:MAG TPA: fatty acid desaturase [Allosphingosinicella sp.]|jgi:fatty acid desaturase